MTAETKKIEKMSVQELTVITTVNMMGSGVIMLPAKLAQVGTESIFSWLVTLTGAICLAYGFARCGMFVQNSSNGMGGYADVAFGKDGNFMANFSYGVASVIGNVAMAVAAVSYGAVCFDQTLTVQQTTMWTMILVTVTTIANFWGPKITGIISYVSVWGAIIPVAVLAVIGWFWFSGSMYVHSWNPHHYGFFTALSSSIPITLWAFIGLESAAANADVVDNPQKNVPIAVVCGTAIAGITYILSTNVMAGIVSNADLVKSTAPFGLTFALMFNPFIGKVVMALMALACVGSLFGWEFTAAEVFRSSANAGYFPKVFKKVNKYGAPIQGLIILLIVQLIMALGTMSANLNKQFNQLVNMAIILHVVPYVLCMASVKVIQLKAGQTDKRARVADVIAFIAGIYSLYSMYSAGPDSMLFGALFAFFGWTLWGLIAGRYLVKEQAPDTDDNNDVDIDIACEEN